MVSNHKMKIDITYIKNNKLLILGNLAMVFYVNTI